MSRPWIARIVLAALTLEVGFLVSLYTGAMPLLARGEEGLFRFLLSQVREVKDEQVILELNAEADQWSLRKLAAVTELAQPWQVVEVPLASELFDGEAPAPSEYAVLLGKLHQAGVRDLAFTSDLTWKEESELELLALDSALRPFETVFLPLNMTEVPRPKGFPQWLRGSSIPREALRGDGSRLPLVNQIVMPPSLSERAGLSYAFPDFGGRDSQFRAPGRLPLLARWEDKLLASWSLTLAMRLEGVAGADLQIEPGRHLRLGSDGPVIPLDDFGRAKVSEESALFELAKVSAKELFPVGEGSLPTLPAGAIVHDLTSPQGRANGEKLLAESQLLRQFPRPGQEEVFTRIRLRWELFLYLEIVLVAIFALHLRPFPQLLALAILWVALYGFVLGILHWRGLWTPVLPLMAAPIFSWCLVGYLQQIAHPVRARKRRAAQTVGSDKEPA